MHTVEREGTILLSTKLLLMIKPPSFHGTEGNGAATDDDDVEIVF